ncbi:S41 family peptidase [Niabella aurantiaca]|uniref:S41 family peptidase n=1 Tax=Niabella aurantiaca TaxID=379900 RepID=UPI0003729742|nr:S41 family peptidase [Niabella aurantiaca]
MSRFFGVCIFLCFISGARAQYLFDRLERGYPPRLMKADIDQLCNDLEKYHLNLYLYASRDRLDKAVDSLKASLTGALTIREFYYRLQQVLSLIGDGHLKTDYLEPQKITGADWIKYGKKYRSPFEQFRLKFIDDKIYISSSSASCQKLVVGAEVIAINKISAAAIIGRKMSSSFSDGYNTTFKYYFLNNGSLDDLWKRVFKTTDRLHVVLRNKGIVDTVLVVGAPFDVRQALERSKETVANADPVDTVPGMIYKKIDASTGYLKISHFHPDQQGRSFFSALLEKELPGCRYLVLDLRGNLGGEMFYMLEVLKALLVKPVHVLKFPGELLKGVSVFTRKNPVKSKRLRYVNQYLQLGVDLISPADASYRNKLYVLINGGTFSAASVLAYALGIDGRALLIGEETGGGRNTMNAGIHFENRLKNTGISYSFGLVPFNAFYPSREKGHGVRPDIAIHYTIDDYISGRDLELEAAMEEIKKAPNE